ncbi:phosphodiesterase [Chromatium weissei]|nr:phosphodiesterase [Chromatium weissei]
MMNTPDYHGSSIVNLMQSIIQARGGRADLPPLTAVPVNTLAHADNLVLLVIDGLGANWLAQHAPQGILQRACCTTLTSVFPSTTASAITTYLTGVAPLQHGITGWFTYLRELGCVMTVLTGKPRYGGLSYRQAGIDPIQLFRHTSIFDRIKTPSLMLSPQHIANSDFNRAHAGAATIIAYDGLNALFQKTLQVLRQPQRLRRKRQFLYLYWPALDSIGHAQGMNSAAAVAHLAQIEQEIAHFLTAAAGTNTLLLVSADHGQLDTSPSERIELIDHSELADCLLLPLCGEPRAAFCYVRANRIHAFEQYCQQTLHEQVELIPSRQLVENGWFGFGTPHSQFFDRIGDYCLLPRGQRIICDRLPSEKPYIQIGVHGGLSAAELMVPLCVLSA